MKRGILKGAFGILLIILKEKNMRYKECKMINGKRVHISFGMHSKCKKHAIKMVLKTVEIYMNLFPGIDLKYIGDSLSVKEYDDIYGVERYTEDAMGSKVFMDINSPDIHAVFTTIGFNSGCIVFNAYNFNSLSLLPWLNYKNRKPEADIEGKEKYHGIKGMKRIEDYD